MNLLRTKTIEQSIADTDEPQRRLNRTLGPLQLTVIGVGVIIGTGIFVLTGKAAGTLAGPAISISFVVSAIVCALAGLCYAELASTVPVAGSAYTFSYATLGELMAWIIGWDLMLELALGAATVASGWSQYFRTVITDAPWYAHLTTWVDSTPHNLVAAAIVVLVAVVLCLGVRLSSGVNAVIVAIKVAIVLLVIVAGIGYIKSANYHPFIPASGAPAAPAPSTGNTLLQDIGINTGTFGIGGIFTGAALVFFAFIGFDIVATTAEEARKPQRDLPIGIFVSLGICAVLYVAVSLVVTGMVRYNHINVKAPLANAFISVGQHTIARIVGYGALAGLTSVVLILMLGQSRVFFAMSRDRLLPPVFSAISERFRTPYRTTLVTGVVVAVLAAVFDINTLSEMVNIGTLFAFMLVSIGVVVLRRTRPDLPRPFRTPLVPVVPALSVLASLWLMLNLESLTWLRFVVWLAIGLVVYFLYGMRHSRLAGGPPGPGDDDVDAGGEVAPRAARSGVN
jgi:APA family basic amino acid/polyamine antiporter